MPSEQPSDSAGKERTVAVVRALRLEYLTIGWNLAEGAIAIAAGAAADSAALVGFGVDSFVESLSGSVLVWRLSRELRDGDSADAVSLESRASRLVSVTLLLLALYVSFEAVRKLVGREAPDPSIVGITLTTVSLAVMWWLARAKRRLALELDSAALEADAFQTQACWWLSAIVLGGLGLNLSLGWWWADPLAALALVPFILAEAREAWQAGDDPSLHGEAK